MVSARESKSTHGKARRARSFRPPLEPNVLLQEERIEAGLSPEQLAKAAGVGSHQTVYDIENGERRATMTTQVRLTRALSKLSVERGDGKVRVRDLFPAPLRKWTAAEA